MSNASASEALRAAIDRVRQLGGIATDVAPAVARELDTEIRGNIAAGRGPDGEAWQLTQKGEVPLRNAGRGLSVRAIGPVVLARLTGDAVRHHLGIARGRITRRVLPTRRMPQPLTEAIKRLVVGRARAIAEGAARG